MFAIIIVTVLSQKQMSTDCFELKHDYELFNDDDDKQEIMEYQENSEAGLDINYISD